MKQKPPVTHAAQLDDASLKALRWATWMLDLEVARDAPDWLKIQDLKAKAAGIVGQLKARVDPGMMRGGIGDEVGDIIASGLKRLKKAG